MPVFSLSLTSTLTLTLNARPDGRPAGAPLSEGISPVQGADRQGPTAVFNSAAKMDHLKTGGTLLNMKFTPQLLEGETDNSLDDNGNGLVDEPGLCFHFEGDSIHVLLTIQLSGAGDVADGGAYFYDIPDGLLRLNLEGIIAHDRSGK